MSGAPGPASPQLPTWLRLLGAALALASLLWIVPQLIDHWEEIRRQDLTPRLLGTIFAVIPVYAVALVGLAVAWWLLCHGAETGPPPFLPTVSVWLRSQIAKYLPGNLMHYLGRHLFGGGLGISQRTLGLASVLELAGCAMAATLLGFPVLLLRFSLPPGATLALLVGAAVVTLLLLAVLGRRLRSSSHTLLITVRRGGFPALLLQVVFFIVSGCLVWILLRQGLGVAAPPWAVIGATSAAWLLGTFTPGAPGGVGIREAVLVWYLTPLVGGGNAAVVAVAWRVVTFLGDLLASGAGWWATRLRSQPA